MPSPEIASTANIPSTDIPEIIAKQPQQKKNPLENYLRSIVLLMAVYALIINRAMDTKKVFHPSGPPPLEVKPDYTKAYAHTPKKQTPLMFNSGMPIIFYPTYFILK